METEETTETEVVQASSDPWALAFESLDKKDEEASAADAGMGAGEPSEAEDLQDTASTDAGEGAAEDALEDGHGAEDLPGGPGDNDGTSQVEDGGSGWLGQSLSEEEIAGYRKELESSIRERTIRDVVSTYINKGARHHDGILGASINDQDICRRDEDGVPRFYNPDTGRQFTGDNPRRQAQEWVDDYNRSLAEMFNKTCQEYSKKLLEEESGKLAIIEFAPKYDKLDPVRKAMFESAIEDYEVTDKNGDIVGYTCDLDKVLAAVNRQVREIRARFGNGATTPTAGGNKAEPSGPALDTPSSGNTGAKEKRNPRSLAEAMEWQQDELLKMTRH